MIRNKNIIEKYIDTSFTNENVLHNLSRKDSFVSYTNVYFDHDKA